MNSTPILLASRSPRRIDLFTNLHLSFRAVESNVDETIKEGSDVRDAVITNALKKAEHAKRLFSKECETVIAADTVVMFQDRIIGKPKDDDDALRILGMLSGNTHIVYTGIAIITVGGEIITDHEETKVTFKQLSKCEINDYVLSGESRDKAGAYGMQGAASVFVERIDGDYFNVIGLPICKLFKHLTRIGCIVFNEVKDEHNKK